MTITEISRRSLTSPWLSGLILVFAVAATLPAQIATDLERVDTILEDEKPLEAVTVLEQLEGRARSGAERSEVYWRLASAYLMHGDQQKDNGASDTDLLAIFERGESYGQQAIDADPQSGLGYYWKSANIGRWGQTKGILNSLFRAPEMRDLLIESITKDPEHADSYYVLGQLYAKVPGVISFGNPEYAVSLARQSIDLMEAEVRSGERPERPEGYYIQLASHLITRDWNQRKRDRSMNGMRNSHRSAGSAVEKGYYYEGTVSIPAADDKREAREILDTVIGRLERVSNPSPSDRRLLTEARELRGGL